MIDMPAVAYPRETLGTPHTPPRGSLGILAGRMVRDLATEQLQRWGQETGQSVKQGVRTWWPPRAALGLWEGKAPATIRKQDSPPAQAPGSPPTQASGSLGPRPVVQFSLPGGPVTLLCHQGLLCLGSPGPVSPPLWSLPTENRQQHPATALSGRVTSAGTHTTHVSRFPKNNNERAKLMNKNCPPHSPCSFAEASWACLPLSDHLRSAPRTPSLPHTPCGPTPPPALL